MLVLTRKPGESIVIGNDVVVTVVEVKGGQVRLGVDAPRNLQVHRDEVYREVMNENAAAARSASLGDDVIRSAVANARQRTGRPDRS